MDYLVSMRVQIDKEFYIVIKRCKRGTWFKLQWSQMVPKEVNGGPCIEDPRLIQRSIYRDPLDLHENLWMNYVQLKEVGYWIHWRFMRNNCFIHGECMLETFNELFQILKRIQDKKDKIFRESCIPIAILENGRYRGLIGFDWGLYDDTMFIIQNFLWYKS